MDRDAVIAEARKLGMELTEADLLPETNAELSEDELDAVAGGGKCACAFGGGSKCESHDLCACVLYGTGLFNDDVKRCTRVGPGGGKF